MTSTLSHTRRLVAALIISGALNVFLAALIFYWTQQESLLTSYCSHSPVAEYIQQNPLIATHRTNSEVICNFRTLSFAQLKNCLVNTEPVEEGYAHRDLALATLVAFHHFDLERALSGYAPIQQRRLAYAKYSDGRTAEVTVYPGLSEKQYENLIDFANTERWPLSSKGLFLALKNNQEAVIDEDSSLKDAFYMTREFLAAEALFGTSQASLERGELLEMLLQGEWKMFANLVGSQTPFTELSSSRRQNFLMDYIQHGSKAAAYLMLKSEGDFALRKLHDNQIIQLLQLLNEERKDSKGFAQALLTSPRSDAVWKEAAHCLYRYTGEVVSQKYDHHAVIASVNEPVLKSPVPEQKEPKAAEKVSTVAVVAPTIRLKPQTMSMVPGIKEKDSLYVVQEGDSLWKISRRFNVDIACLKSHNRLDSDLLRPGKSLRIPKLASANKKH